jgi:hypothetical protein
MILIITYDLKTPGRKYSPLYETIKAQGRWWHYLKSTWLIDTQKTPEQVAEAINPYLGEDDNLLVAEMGTNYQGWLPSKAWDWIRRHEG